MVKHMIDDAFNKSVDYYDTWIRKALPCYDELFSVATECIPFGFEERLDVLDLGAGTGSYSRHILQRYPNARFTLVDVADKMLAIAKKRFAGFEDQFSFITGDYRETWPDRPFDLVVSSLSIHHLEDDEKQRLFKKIWASIKPGGAFINVDQIKAPDEYFHELYGSTWLKQVRQNGASEQQIQASIQRRKDFDKDSTLGDQLNWLKDAGFENADCLYHHYFVGVFLALKFETSAAAGA
jgi:tRNA (cmo5U34)-methyltransferase